MIDSREQFNKDIGQIIDAINNRRSLITDPDIRYLLERITKMPEDTESVEVWAKRIVKDWFPQEVL